MISWTLVGVFFVTLIFAWYYRRMKAWQRRMGGLKELPGPRSYPLVGNILMTMTDLTPPDQHLKFNKLSEKYGDIFRLDVSPFMYIVMVSNPKTAKDMLLNDGNYNGRGYFPNVMIYENEKLGIVNSDGEMWEVHRRFLLRQLRDFGFGKPVMENLILEEVRELLDSFRRRQGSPVSDIKKSLQLAVINSLWIVVSKKRFDHDDPKLTKLVENIHNMTSILFKEGSLIIMAPWTKHIAPEYSGYNKVRKLIEENRRWFEEDIAKHKKSLQEDNPRDFIDLYLAEVKKTTDPSSFFYGALAERQLVATLSDLLFAGSDTTSTTLSWATLYLCKFPHIQKKLQDEITSITNGNSRNVHITDRPNMPYTLALIDEVFRFSSIVPGGVAHRAIADKGFQGYFIPKDALIMVDMFYMHHSSKYWENPETFRPERFLSEDGKTYIKSDNLFPFQMGRRQCVGETLARDTIFLFLTNIFQAFTIRFDPNEPEPSIKPETNFILEPQTYSVVLKDRLES